jgi:DNA invertase Pin-like site-specific DNA recombinase
MGRIARQSKEHTPMPVHKAPEVAYSYIRFSTPEQRRGDSLRRQTESAADWCKRNDVRLDTSRTLHDLGKSAFKGNHRKNPDRNALAAFLQLVEDGRIPRGSYLVVESLDRLTREHVRPALTLLLNLIEAGVRIVQLHPVEVVYDEDVDPMTLMMALMELSRGNSESAMKAERLGKAWENKRSHARDKGELLTRQLPAWIEERDGKLYTIPTKALAVERIYELSAEGFGSSRIVKQLVREGLPPLTDKWLASYVRMVLNDRRAVGEFQMRRCDGSPDGEPAKGYFPAVISEELWQRARAGVNTRRLNGKKGQGSYDKAGGFVNLFTGLLRDARDDGSSYNVTVNTGTRGGLHRVLRNLSLDGRGPSVSFPYETFEKAVLSALREIDPADVIEEAERPNERLAIAAELEKTAGQISKIKENILSGGDVESLADVLRQLDVKRRELIERDREVKQRAAAPLKDAWQQTKSLLGAIEKADDPHDYRVRLRAALRREIDSIWVLIVPRGRDRLCATQIWFAGGKQHRDYLVFHQAAKANSYARTEGAWWAKSLTSVAKPGELDLRLRDHTRRLEKALAEVELT